jgi:misacylated tRNA(Ala) deacylase
MPTACLFRDDSYLRECEARVIAVNEQGIVLDRTVLYATSGGQPNDTGHLRTASGLRIAIANVIFLDQGKTEIAHVPAPGSWSIGTSVTRACACIPRFICCRRRCPMR